MVSFSSLPSELKKISTGSLTVAVKAKRRKTSETVRAREEMREVRGGRLVGPEPAEGREPVDVFWRYPTYSLTEYKGRWLPARNTMQEVDLTVRGD